MERNNVFPKLFVSCLGIGYSPVLPGTLASVVGLLIYVVIFFSFPFYLLSFFFLCGAGLWASHLTLQTTDEKDPSWIVMDEVVGMMVTFFLIPPQIPFLVIGFALFRFFDSVKVFPINLLEGLKGEWGIFFDDIGAGIYANLFLQVLLRVSS